MCALRDGPGMAWFELVQRSMEVSKCVHQELRRRALFTLLVYEFELCRNWEGGLPSWGPES